MESQNINELKQLFNSVLNEIQEVSKFVDYDIGLSYTNDEYKSYEERCTVCNNIPIGILNQGMFQETQLDASRYKDIQDFLEDNKSIIAEINFFMLSESLQDGVSAIMDVVPLLNIYHSALGITFVDKYGKIIRSAVLQLNFGALDGLEDAFTRFVCPQFCMNMIKDPKTGIARDPRSFTPEEITTNLFIDYSKSISSFLFTFNETKNYVTEDLVKTMACVDVANLYSAPPVFFKSFTNQNITCQQLYDSYNLQRNGLLKKFQGNADGTIFCLNSYGPSVYTSQAGVILNFAKLKNVEKMKKWIDWCFVNYGSCSQSLVRNNLMYYCLVGIDKVTPINELNDIEIKKILKKPNVLSTDNGFIREMKGRVTHCNIVVAVCITLIDQLAYNDRDWTIYTNWEDNELQEMNHYMINPSVVNLPIISFPDGWENGVSVKDLNLNPKYKDDKFRFYKLWYFGKLLIKGLYVQASSSVITTNKEDPTLNMISMVYLFLVEIFNNGPLNMILKGIAPNLSVKLNQGKLILNMLLFLYVVITFNLFDTFYWATGQSLIDSEGNYDILFTDQYPTIWKIPLNKENKNVLKAYIESFFQKQYNTELKTAGQIYTDLKNNDENSYGIYYLNRMVHAFPNNKFFLWFPGVKPGNNCSNGYLKERSGITYLPKIKYNMVSAKDSNSLNLGRKEKTNDNRFKYTILLLIVILMLLLTMGFFYYIHKNKRQ